MDGPISARATRRSAIWSSFRRHPILKINRTFTPDLIHDHASHASHAMVTKIIELPHMLDMLVVTEGVETATQCAAASLLGERILPGLVLRPSHVGRMPRQSAPGAGIAEPRTWWHVRYDPGLP